MLRSAQHLSNIAIVGPVFPYRAGIAYCTTRLAEELGADVISFKRQYPRRWYPGGDDVDPTLPRANADSLSSFSVYPARSQGSSAPPPRGDVVDACSADLS